MWEETHVGIHGFPKELGLRGKKPNRTSIVLLAHCFVGLVIADNNGIFKDLVPEEGHIETGRIAQS